MQPTVRTDASVPADAASGDGGDVPVADASAPDAGSSTGRACSGWPTDRPLRVVRQPPPESISAGPGERLRALVEGMLAA